MKLWNLQKRKTAKSREKPREKNICKNLHTLFEGRERVLNAFESKIFPIEFEVFSDKVSDNSNLSILTHKQMLQRLPIALAQEKTGKTSKSLLN